MKEIRSQINSQKKGSLGLASFYAAEVDFEKIKKERETYQKIKLRFPPDALVSLFKKKQKALLKLASSYDNIVEFGVPEWGVAALFEKGEAYQELAESFRQVKIPKQYKNEERAEIEAGLKGIEEKEIVPVEKAGKEIWEACAKRASEFKVVSVYAEKCREKIGKSALTFGVLPKSRSFTFGPWSEKSPAPSEIIDMEDKEAALNQLTGMVVQNRSAKAEGLIKKYLIRYPEEKRALFLLAAENLKNGKKELASYFFNLLLKDEGFSWKSLVSNNLGVIALQEKNRLQGIAFLEEAAGQSPEHPSIYLNLGSLYIEGHGFKDALPLFEKAHRLNQKSEEAALGLGLSLESEGKFEEAAKVYQECISDNPDASQVLFNYAIVLGNQLKQREKASQLMLRYIQKGGRESSRAHEIMKNWR